MSKCIALEDNFGREREIQQEVGQLDWDMSIIIMMEKKLEKKLSLEAFTG